MSILGDLAELPLTEAARYVPENTASLRVKSRQPGKAKSAAKRCRITGSSENLTALRSALTQGDTEYLISMFVR